VARGRFLAESDQAGGRRVAVLDGELAREIFGRQDPLGQRVTIHGVPVIVVGVLEEKKSLLDFLGMRYVYVPLRTWQYIFHEPAVIHQLEGATADREQVAEALQKTLAVLERRHDAPGRYIGSSLEQEMEIVGQATGIITLVVGAIAGISLFVGGVGVMNIMLVSVTERVREIGIRMVVGARRRDILVQFLIEAVVLCLLGGLVGVLIGVGGAMLIAKLANWPPLISWWTVLLAVVFSGAVGVFFGIYPANQAARLDPIEALRRE
jgi:putative ABC transport system permease protein